MYSIPKENVKEFELTGILQAHNDGYLGQEITMMEWESCNPNHPMYHGMVRDPFGIGYNSYKNTHGGKVVDVKHQGAPKAIIYIASNGQRSNGTGSFFEQTIPFILENRINLVGASLGGMNNTYVREVFKKLIKNGTIISTSAGNSGKRGLGSYAKTELAISVGAIGVKSKDDIFYKSYSSRGKELDYTDFSGLYVHDARKPSRVFKQEGTSFSYPLFESKLALTQDMFLKNAGRTLYQEEMIMFLDDHLIDLGTIGWDEYYGKGLYVIPKYNQINYNKYLLKGGKTFPMPDNPIYRDLEDHWSRQYVEKVEKKLPNAFDGYPDETFKPDAPVTRGELAKILSKII